jgi:hypothetical protein
MAEALGSVHTRVRGYFEGMVASSPEVSFWPDGITSPGNYG